LHPNFRIGLINGERSPHYPATELCVMDVRDGWRDLGQRMGYPQIMDREGRSGTVSIFGPNIWLQYLALIFGL
ncbi:MAG: hypothetical protein VKJ64_20190, partial [Leptolyngbyaceae bacterium]|nr:hypothetical protein [Leptolyngbyaceae bacterium]